MPDTYEPLPALLGRIGGGAGGQSPAAEGDGRVSVSGSGSPPSEGGGGGGGGAGDRPSAAALSALASSATVGVAAAADAGVPVHGGDELVSGSGAVRPVGVVGGALSVSADSPSTAAVNGFDGPASGGRAGDLGAGRGGREAPLGSSSPDMAAAASVAAAAVADSLETMPGGIGSENASSALGQPTLSPTITSPEAVSDGSAVPAAAANVAEVAARSGSSSAGTANGDGSKSGRFGWILKRFGGGGGVAAPPPRDDSASAVLSDGLIPPRPLPARAPPASAAAPPTTRHALEVGSVALPGTPPPGDAVSPAGSDNGDVASAVPRASPAVPAAAVPSEEPLAADLRSSDSLAATARVHPWPAPTDNPLGSTDVASKSPGPSSSREAVDMNHDSPAAEASTIVQRSLRVVGEDLPRSLPARTRSSGGPFGSMIGGNVGSDGLSRHALEVGTLALPARSPPGLRDSLKASSGTFATATGTHALPTGPPAANDEHPFPAPFGSRPTSTDDAGDGPVFPTVAPAAPGPTQDVRALEGLAATARVHPWPAPFGTRPTSTDDAGDGPVFPATPAPDGSPHLTVAGAAAAARAAAAAMSDPQLAGTPQPAAAGSRPTSLDDAGDGPVVPGYFPDRSPASDSQAVRAAARSARAGSRPTSEDDAGDGPVIPLYYPDAVAAVAGDWGGRRVGRSVAAVVDADCLGGLIPPRWSAVSTAPLPSLAWTADPTAHGLDVGTVALPRPADAVLPGTHSDMKALADWWASLDVPPMFSRDPDTSGAGEGPTVSADSLGGLLPRRWDAAPASGLPAFVRDTNAERHALEVGSVALPRPEDAVHPPPPPPLPVRAGAGSRVKSAEDVGDGPEVPVYRGTPRLPEEPQVSAGAGTRRVADGATERGDGPAHATAAAAAPAATAAPTEATESGAADQPLAASLLTNALAAQVAARANAEAEAAALAAHMDEVVTAAVAARVEELRTAAAAAADGVVKEATIAAEKATASAVRGIADGAAAAVAATRQAAAASVTSATAAEA